MIKNIRVISQQLSKPVFNNPKDLVLWMGAIQAQDYNMCKWAVGVRLKQATISDVEAAMQKGDILRTHVMRPTWHLVAAEDIRWMLKLSAERINSATASRDRDLEIDEKLYSKCNKLFEKMLCGNKNLTRPEIADELSQAGIAVNPSRMIHFMMRAEVEGIVCSGADKGKKTTYALLEERVKPQKEIHKEEALARLATKYFQSHSPASLNDFVWWSGLTAKDAKLAIEFITHNLFTEKCSDDKMFIHNSYKQAKPTGDTLHYLPSFDEFLISYKNREHVIKPEHYSKAFTNNGIFYPIIMHNGQIIGTWKKPLKTNGLIETSYFTPVDINSKLSAEAELRYLSYSKT